MVDTSRTRRRSGQLLLFVVLAAGATLDDDLTGGSARRSGPAVAAPRARRHPPGAGIPRTLSGKKLEVPVRKILLGTEPEGAVAPNALADPDALRYYGRFQEKADPS